LNELTGSEGGAESPSGAARWLLRAAVLLGGGAVAAVALTGGGLWYGPLMTATPFDFIVPLLALPLAALCAGLALAAPRLRRAGRAAVRLGLGAAGAMLAALAVLLTAGAAAGGPVRLTCLGARARLQPAAATGAALEFAGGMGEWHTAPFVAATGWRVAWASDTGELHLRLFDAAAAGPQRRATGPYRGPAYLGALLAHTGHEAVTGSAAPPGAGTYCLTISSGFHYEPGVDNARRPRPRWRVTVEGARPVGGAGGPPAGG
jgi:hypothetical protein